MNNLLHIVQMAPHEPLKIFCNLKGLEAFIKVLEAASKNKETFNNDSTKGGIYFFPSDGEGYNIEIHLADWDTISKLPSPYYTETVNQYIEAIKQPKYHTKPYG